MVSGDGTSPDAAASVLPDPLNASIAVTRHQQPRQSILDISCGCGPSMSRSGSVTARKEPRIALADRAAVLGSVDSAGKAELRTTGLTQSNSAGQELHRLPDKQPESPATPRDGRGRPLRGHTPAEPPPCSGASSQLRTPRTSRGSPPLSLPLSGSRASTVRGDRSAPATPRSLLSQSKRGHGFTSAIGPGRVIVGGPCRTPRRTLERAAARSAQAAAASRAVPQTLAPSPQRRKTVGATPRRRSSQLDAQRRSGDGKLATGVGCGRVLPASSVTGTHDESTAIDICSGKVPSQRQSGSHPEPSHAGLGVLPAAHSPSAHLQQQRDTSDPFPNPDLEPPTPSPQPQPRVLSISTQLQQPLTPARVLQVRAS